MKRIKWVDERTGEWMNEWPGLKYRKNDYKNKYNNDKDENDNDNKENDNHNVLMMNWRGY